MPSEAVIEAGFQSREIGELAGALAIAQGEFEPAMKDREAEIKNDKTSYKYKYADLASCLESVRRPLARNGLAVLQLTELAGNEILLKTMLIHKSGQWIASLFPLPINESSWARAQNVGSLLAYYRRYTLCALLQIATEDDDGHAGASTAPRRDDDRRPRQDDRRPERQERPSSSPVPGPMGVPQAPEKAATVIPAAAKTYPAYEAWLDQCCEYVNRQWLDSLPRDGNAKAPAEVMVKFQLNRHLLKALGRRDAITNIEGSNIKAGAESWKADPEAMLAEARAYCRRELAVAKDALEGKSKRAREPGADDGPSEDEHAVLDELTAGTGVADA